MAPSGGTLTVVTGQSRSGKTYWTDQQTRRDANVLVWDSMGEFCPRRDFRHVPGMAELHALVTRGARGRFACAWPVDARHFDAFCRFAWVWIRASHKAGRRVTIIVEELADVTSPGKAPAAWGEIVRKSLRYNPSIYALTQRPAESDKTVLGNASVLHCHAMARAEDRRYMARELDVDQGAIDALDMSRYQWIARDNRTRKLTGGGKGRAPKIAR